MSLSLKTAAFLAFASTPISGQTPPPPPARTASNIVIQRSGGSFLGIAVIEIDADRAKALKLKDEHGVEVKIVDENSPASKAGLKAGDVLLEYNGQRIEGTAQFIRMVSETPAGRKANLQVSRAGAMHSLPVTLEARSGRGGFSFTSGAAPAIAPMPAMPAMPAMPPMPAMEMGWNTPRLGIETESLNSQLAEYFGVKEGVLIRSVSKSSAAEKAGLKAGDVVTRVNGDVVRNAGEITMKILPPNAGKTVTLHVVRNHKEMTVEVTLNSDRRSQLEVPPPATLPEEWMESSEGF